MRATNLFRLAESPHKATVRKMPETARPFIGSREPAVAAPRRDGGAATVAGCSAVGGEPQVDAAVSWIEPAGGDDLAPGVEVHALGAVHMGVAEQRRLPAAEGVIGHRHRDRHVHADHADLDLVLEPARGAAVVGEDRGAVPVRVAGDDPHAVVVGGRADDRQHGTEDLVPVAVHFGRDMVEHGGPEPEAVARQHRDKVASYLDGGVSHGATLAVDGRSHEVPAGDGFWLGPTVLDHVTPEMDCYRDEIFGPVLSVVRASSYDDGMRIIAGNPYGNGTAIFTNAGGAARRFQNEVEVGMIGVNVPIPVPMAYYSFGGWKASL